MQLLVLRVMKAELSLTYDGVLKTKTKKQTNKKSRHKMCQCKVDFQRHHRLDSIFWGSPTSELDMSQKILNQWLGFINGMKMQCLLEEHYLFQGQGNVWCGLLQELDITFLAASPGSHQDTITSGWQHHLQQQLEYNSMIPAAVLPILHHFYSLPYLSSVIYWSLCLLANNHIS